MVYMNWKKLYVTSFAQHCTEFGHFSFKMPGPNPKTGVPANLNKTHLNLLTIDCLIYF